MWIEANFEDFTDFTQAKLDLDGDGLDSARFQLGTSDSWDDRAHKYPQNSVGSFSVLELGVYFEKYKRSKDI